MLLKILSLKTSEPISVTWEPYREKLSLATAEKPKTKPPKNTSLDRLLKTIGIDYNVVVNSSFISTTIDI